MKEDQQILFPIHYSELSGLQEVSWQEEYNHQYQFGIPFLYEAAESIGLVVWKPWEHADISIPAILKEWEKIKIELNYKFSNRDNQAASPLMKMGISFFYEMLFWCNRNPVTLEDHHSFDLQIKPVNVDERLNFILTHVNNYHSFVQLSELFIEMMKQFSAKQVTQKSV